MTRRASISILCYAISVLTAQAQWSKQDSIRLQELLNGNKELDINTEAVKSIRFDFNASKEQIKADPLMSNDKPWMKFLKDLPKNFDDTTRWVRPKFVRLTPYTPYTIWHEDPVNDPIFLSSQKDTLKMSWKLNVKLIPGLRNGYVPLPAGMDQSLTPSNNPLIGLDADKLLYENFTKRGRAIRRNRKRAKAWKIYQNYVPTRQDSMLFYKNRKEPMQDTLSTPKDSAAAARPDTLLLKDKINGKDQAEESRQMIPLQLHPECPNGK